MRQDTIIRYYLLLTVFVSGATVMGLEMLGFRLFAPYFGYSIYIWGALIGVVMLALAMGYYVGGSLADRYAKPALLYLIIGIGAGYCLLIYFFSPYVLRSLLSFDIVTGSCLASLAIFGPPMFLLSMVSPFSIGILAQVGSVGSTAGRIYGLSTAGSILGTFLSAFYLIPTWGSQAAILFCFAALLMITIFGLLLWSKRAALLLPLLLLTLLPHSDPTREFLAQGRPVLFDEESQYSRVFVFEDPESDSISLETVYLVKQSILFRNQLLTDYVWDYYNLGPMISPQAKNYLLLGTAGGVVVKQLRHFFPNMTIDAVDIDEKVIQAGQKFFGLKEDDHVKLHIQDARPFLDRSKEKYDLIGIDLNGGDISYPFYVATEEFYRLVKEHLTENGNVIFNLVDPSQDRILIQSITNTVAKVFPSVFIVPISRSSSALIALPYPISQEDLLSIIHASPIVGLETVASLATLQMSQIKFDPKLPVLSDDLSPIEKLSYRATVEHRRRLAKESL